MRRAEEMSEVLARYEASGLTQKAFAEREGVPYTTLMYWRRRLRTGSAKEAKPAPAMLAPVTIVPDRPRGRGSFEVRTAGGAVVTVPPGFDEGELRRLLGALSTC